MTETPESFSAGKERTRRAFTAVGRQRRRQMVTLSAIAVKTANQAGATLAAIRGDSMAYKMTAERDTETVKSERTSLIIAVAKARVFASEGWQVTITTDDGKVFAPAAFDTLLAA
jgi:hypothetical protein